MIAAHGVSNKRSIGATINKRPRLRASLCATIIAISGFIALAGTGNLATAAHAAPLSADAKWFRADKPIRDLQGRIRYIVALEAPEVPKTDKKFKNIK